MPPVLRGSVNDAARALIRAADRLREFGAEADRAAAELEARWAANRAARRR
jgi:hypothetical protein